MLSHSHLFLTSFYKTCIRLKWLPLFFQVVTSLLWNLSHPIISYQKNLSFFIDDVSFVLAGILLISKFLSVFFDRISGVCFEVAF